MPWDEALMRAGSLDALRPHLCAGSILARHNGLYYWPGGGARSGPGNIRPGLWADARVDPATGRVIFTMVALVRLFFTDSGDDRPPVTSEVFALGIELERTAVEIALKPPGRKRGTKPSKVWQEIFEHFDAIVAREGKFLSVGSAASSVEAWLEENNKVLSRSAIERGIPKYRPDWITA
jgi:hypothetical protein